MEFQTWSRGSLTGTYTNGHPTPSFLNWDMTGEEKETLQGHPCELSAELISKYKSFQWKFRIASVAQSLFHLHSQL